MSYNINDFKELRIMYVEDELDLQKVVVTLLFDIVKKIDYFSNGVDAFDSFNDNNYDLIITDINIPKLNGLLLIEKIRKNNKSIPIIVTTAYDSNYVNNICDLSINAYILKPLDFNDLLTCINKYIK